MITRSVLYRCANTVAQWNFIVDFGRKVDDERSHLSVIRTKCLKDCSVQNALFTSICQNQCVKFDSICADVDHSNILALFHAIRGHENLFLTTIVNDRHHGMRRFLGPGVLQADAGCHHPGEPPLRHLRLVHAGVTGGSSLPLTPQGLLTHPAQGFVLEPRIWSKAAGQCT